MTMQRWRGLKSLIQESVEQASHAIERVQKDTAKRPFGILEQLPVIATPARGVHVLHDAAVSGVHGAIRLVTRAVGGTVDVVLDAVDKGTVGTRP